MPTLTRTALENAASDIGYSRGQSKSLASRILARDDFDYIQEQLLNPDNARTWADPTGEEAVMRVMYRALMATMQNEEVAA